MTATCSKCLAPATVLWSPGVELCHACMAIETHRIQRRDTFDFLRKRVGCEHLHTPWALGGRRSATPGKRWYQRECVRCRRVDEELSKHRPTDENSIDWIKLT